MNISLDKINLLTLNVGYAVHNADWNWKNVQSPFSRIYLVTEGSARIVMNNKKYVLTPNHLYIIPANIVHDYECDGHFCHYYLHVYEEREYDTSLFEKFDFPFEVDAREEDLFLMKRICALLPDQALPGSNPSLYDNRKTFLDDILRLKHHDIANRIEIRGINLVFLSRFMFNVKDKQMMQDERIMKVIDYVHEHIYDIITIDQLADISCLSRGYMVGLFKQKVGMSPLQYINKLKIEKAQLILLTSNMQVKNIAYVLGFNDYSYFNRLFKKTTGFSPLLYKKLNAL